MFVVPVSRNGSHLARGFDRFFDERFDRLFAAGVADATRSPALDVAESDGAYTVKLDMPGVAKEDVKVSIDGRNVTVQADTRKEQTSKDGDRIVYRERATTSYSRSFKLAGEVDQAASSARLENGVLVLTLAKRSPKTATRITVN